jgi:hypothetical protein
MQTQRTPSRFSRAHGFALAIGVAVAASTGAQPARPPLTIDGSSAARFEASVAAIQNDSRTFSREEFETALAAIWFSNTAGSGDLDRDGDRDASDLRMLRDDSFDLLTNIQRGNIANAIEERATDANPATDYFRQLDGLARDEIVELASRPEAAAYLAPLWKYRHDDLCRRAFIQSTHLSKNCRRDTSTAQVFDAATAKMLNTAVEALNENRFDEARAAVDAVSARHLTPYEVSKVEQIRFNVAYAEQDYAGARVHLQKAIAAGGLSPQELSVAVVQIRALESLLAANGP